MNIISLRDALQPARAQAQRTARLAVYRQGIDGAKIVARGRARHQCRRQRLGAIGDRVQPGSGAARRHRSRPDGSGKNAICRPELRERWSQRRRAMGRVDEHAPAAGDKDHRRAAARQIVEAVPGRLEHRQHAGKCGYPRSSMPACASAPLYCVDRPDRRFR